MEQISPKYMISLISKIKNELVRLYSSSEIRAYLERWMVRNGSVNQNFRISLCDNGDINLDNTIHNIDDETLLKIAIDLEIETPDFIPCIPTIKNEVKASYRTAGKAFDTACKKVESEPENAILLSNSALESIIREILKDERIDNKPKGKATLYELAIYCLKVGSIYSLFGHPNRQNPLICRTTVV